MEFPETCRLNGAELYLDSLILNMQLGHMPCHRNIAKLEGVDTVPDLPVDLTASTQTQEKDIPETIDQEINSDVKPLVKHEHKKEMDIISSMSVLYTQPKNKLKTSMYKKLLQLLLKAKADIKTKTKCKEKTDCITVHIQNASIDPAKVAEHACQRRTTTISSKCELCDELCQS